MNINRIAVVLTGQSTQFHKFQNCIPCSGEYIGTVRLILVFVLLLFVLATNAQPLSGSYTIGGSNPDFSDFNEAVDHLEDEGVSGPVVFNVRQGEYVEQISINEFAGSSAANTVTFQSESGNTGDVVLRHTHQFNFTSSNYTISVNGADNMVFRNMTVRADPMTIFSQDRNRVVYVSNNTNNLLFENTKILSWYTDPASLSEQFYCVRVTNSGSESANNNIRFINNYFYGGVGGIRINGSWTSDTTMPNNCIIENNIFHEHSTTAISLLNCRNTHISGNRILSPELETDGLYKGIHITGHEDSLSVDANNIQIRTEGIGVEVVDSNAESSGYNQVTNNMIYINNLPGNDLTAGIQMYTSNALLIAFNSINIQSESGSGSCLKAASNDSCSILNNQLINGGGGLCYSMTNFNENDLNSDYNNLYNGGNAIAEINGNTYDSLSELFSGLGLDEHSSYENPMLVSDTLLIPTNAELYDTGTPISSITHDYFGTPRSSTSPDIGYFEGDITSFDAGISNSISIDLTACATDSLPLYARITNYGEQTLNSVDILYEINGDLFPSFNWTGNLEQGESTNDILLGYTSMSGADGKSFKIWTSAPNGQLDNQNLNDTIQFYKNAAMSGTYVIGTSEGFPTISNAIQTVIDRGVCGPVVFNIEPGVYDEQLYITSIEGTSEENTVTFQSSTMDSTDVEIKYSQQFSNTNFILRIEGAQFLRFRHLTLYSYHYSRRDVIDLEKGASNNIFSNNHILSGEESEFGTLMDVYGENDFSLQPPEYVPVHNTTIENNRISGGYYQLKVISNINYPASGNEVVGNVFDGPTHNSLTLLAQNYFVVKNNVFDGVREGLTNDYGCLSIEGCTNGGLIEKNAISIFIPTGINGLVDCSGTSENPIVIRNNVVSAQWNSTPYSQLLMGFTFENSSHVLVVNNSFNLVSNSNVMARFTSGSSDISLFNNAFKSHGETKVYTFFSSSDPGSITSDFNGVSLDENVEVQNGSEYYSWEEWQNLGFDNNSVLTSIHYQDVDDLHIDNAVGLSGMGTPLPEVTEDIDGEARDPQFPDIGADEWEIDSLSYHDIKIARILSPDSGSCEAADSLKLEIVNKSAIPIDSYSIKWWLYGNFQDSIFISETIAPYDTAIVNIGSFQFVPNTGYGLSFEINHPNGTHDNFFNDNTKSTYYYYLDNATIYQHIDADCTDEIQLLIKSFPHESIMWSDGSTENNIIISEPGTYSVTVTSNAGCIVSDTITIE